MTPAVVALQQDNTHRLIPARFDEPVLRPIAADARDFESISELESATNERVLRENNRLPGIESHELVFGVSYEHIVRAAFAHPAPGGSRFNSGDRGAWYAGFEVKTAQAEVAYHRSQELKEIPDWKREEVSDYVDYMADFRSQFHDIRGAAKFKKCLDPNSYAESQRLAAALLQAGSHGVAYESVRRQGGTCLACFRPAVVMNVRRGREFQLTFGKDGELRKVEAI